MNAATIAALCTGIAGILTAVAAMLHSMNTRTATTNAMEKIAAAIKPVPAKGTNDTNAG